MRGSGLVVNEGKTEICLFSRNDPPTITLKLDGALIESLKVMNVLGVLFDSKLSWVNHVAHSICKAKRKLFGLRLLRKYFNHSEMKTLLDSYFYSVLYYNVTVWLTTELISLAQDLNPIVGVW